MLDTETYFNHQELLDWLFKESAISRSQMSHDLGISEATLSRIASGVTCIDNAQFGNIYKLIQYAKQIKCKSEGC